MLEDSIRIGGASASRATAARENDLPVVGRTVITVAGERAVRDELRRLRHQLEVEIAERLREAREFGEPAGNDELLQIREEEAVLSARVARLQAMLDNATVVADDAEGDTAAIGTAVEVDDLDTGKRAEYLLVDGFERLTSNAASAASPLGQALIGNAPGAEVRFELPSGRVRSLRIVAVRPPVLAPA